MDGNFKELEYKFNADDIKLQEFIHLMNTLGYHTRKDTSSWDHYYTNANPDEFQRFRESETPELTKKRKVKSTNNWDRVEVDLPLDAKKVTEDIVHAYVSLDGYKKNFSIYKSCFIFWFDNVNYVYYITYDTNMKELNRFIEVEVNKEKVTDLLSLRDQEIGSFNGPIQVLNEAEQALKSIGITPQNRMKRSLFELYRR
ncbi:MAG TPA: hypothetical protein VIL57_03330 [Bacteroidia bacterium]